MNQANVSLNDQKIKHYMHHLKA